MKAPKFATMSLDALYKMRGSLETAIGKQLKAARKGIASLPGMGTAKPKRKKAAGKTAARKTTARKSTAKAKTARGTKKPMRAAATARSTSTARTSGRCATCSRATRNAR
jgi:hypothetical protein